MTHSADFVSESQRLAARLFALAILLLAVSLPLPLAATVSVTTDFHAGNVGIISTSFMVVFQQPWTAQSYAQAQNTHCKFDVRFDTCVGGCGTSRGRGDGRGS